jgi:hypothetical protein
MSAFGEIDRHADAPYSHCYALIHVKSREEYDRLIQELMGNSFQTTFYEITNMFR